ncbi:MAG: gliding motility-associated ABC transporter substrate-binding protein GldG [Flavobacteriaceae bacterium]|nr:gliding motility-associated ABC transporter substrate-binding protein GldG [Flavobacteriaceae bacterium]
MLTYKKPIFILSLTLLFIGIFQQITFQKDLTADKRYSLSETSILQLKALDEPVRIDIFLNGKLPGLYRDFWRELNIILNQMQFYSDKLIIQFNNPLEIDSNERAIAEMEGYGMKPEIVIEKKDGQRSESIVFPWMIVNSGNVSERVFLLDKQFGDTERNKITRSIQQIEYLILDGIRRVTLKEKSNLAVLTSHQTSKNIKLADLLQSLKPYYNLASFNLKNHENTPLQSLNNLKRFDALIVSNPNEPFSKKEKYILDQYELYGGGILWMINGIAISRDSLFNNSGKAYGFPLELNLDDYFFVRGIRLNKILVKDLYSAPLVLATGNQNNTQYIPYPWPYFPLHIPESNLIGQSVGPVLTQFASSLDSLENSLNKTVLLKTSAFTKTAGVPVLLLLEEATKKIQPSKYNEPSKILGILAEGTGKSLFLNRVKPFVYNKHQDKGGYKSIIFGDGSIGENQIERGAPLNLGYDKWTSNYYANKQLLINSIHYLTGNQEGLIIRQKKWNFAYLDPQKINSKGIFWKMIIILSPILISLLFGLFIQKGRSKHMMN